MYVTFSYPYIDIHIVNVEETKKRNHHMRDLIVIDNISYNYKAH